MKQFIKSILKLLEPYEIKRRIFFAKLRMKHVLSGKNEVKELFSIINKNPQIIYVLCPDLSIPLGGIKYLYRHVDVLNKNGFPAVILHENLGFRCDWFENDTIVEYRKNIKFRQKDVIVIHETYGPDLDESMKGIRKVILNQSGFCTFKDYPADIENLKAIYLDKEVKAVFCTSDYIYRYMKYVFPNINIFRGRLGIDNSMFQYNAEKEDVIAFMPRKSPGDVREVINALKFRGALKGFRIEKIDNVSEAEVAKILHKSLIFLSFSEREGFSLPPLEAMACGCVVVGYHGMGGKEYFNSDFSYPVEAPDVLAFASTVEKVIQEYRQNKNYILDKAKKASEYARTHYSLKGQEEDIIKFWKQFI